MCGLPSDGVFSPNHHDTVVTLHVTFPEQRLSRHRDTEVILQAPSFYRRSNLRDTTPGRCVALQNLLKSPSINTTVPAKAGTVVGHRGWVREDTPTLKARHDEAGQNAQPLPHCREETTACRAGGKGFPAGFEARLLPAETAPERRFAVPGSRRHQARRKTRHGAPLPTCRRPEHDATSAFPFRNGNAPCLPSPAGLRPPTGLAGRRNRGGSGACPDLSGESFPPRTAFPGPGGPAPDGVRGSAQLPFLPFGGVSCFRRRGFGLSRRRGCR